MPDPIIDPTTIMVASRRLRPRINLGEFVVTHTDIYDCLTLVDRVI